MNTSKNINPFYSLLFLLFLLVQSSVFAQNILENNIKKHISFLASDSLKGRGTATLQCHEAAEYIAKQFKEIGLEAKGQNNTYLYKYNFKYNPIAHKTVQDSGTIEKQSENVIGFLDNNKQHTIVVGAHYDHLGLGTDHNSLDPNPEGKIHNGADDNASGTAGVIELARYFKENKITENYNYLFVCFSGEELGLFGSKQFCEMPQYNLSSINFMLNMDMIGRLNDSTKKIVIYGVGTAPQLVSILNSIPSKLVVKQDSSGVGPSDQTSFYLKNIPVLHYFTGQHSDYHKPSDDVEKINFVGEALVLNHVISTLKKIDDLPKLEYLKTRDNVGENKTSFKVTLGIMPDYMFDGKGVKADGVTDGKTASKAGIKAGDVIIKMGDIDIDNMQTYMKALGKFSKGEATKVKIMRGKEVLELDATF